MNKVAQHLLDEIETGLLTSLHDDINRGGGEWLVGRNDLYISQDVKMAADGEKNVIETVIDLETDEGGNPTVQRKLHISIVVRDAGEVGKA